MCRWLAEKRGNKTTWRDLQQNKTLVTQGRGRQVLRLRPCLLHNRTTLGWEPRPYGRAYDRYGDHSRQTLSRNSTRSELVPYSLPILCALRRFPIANCSTSIGRSAAAATLYACFSCDFLKSRKAMPVPSHTTISLGLCARITWHISSIRVTLFRALLCVGFNTTIVVPSGQVRLPPDQEWGSTTSSWARSSDDKPGISPG